MHVIFGLLWETCVVRTLKDTLGDLENWAEKGWRILESMDLLDLQPEADGVRYCPWQWERNMYTWLSAVILSDGKFDDVYAPLTRVALLFIYFSLAYKYHLMEYSLDLISMLCRLFLWSGDCFCKLVLRYSLRTESRRITCMRVGGETSQRILWCCRQETLWKTALPALSMCHGGGELVETFLEDVWTRADLATAWSSFFEFSIGIGIRALLRMSPLQITPLISKFEDWIVLNSSQYSDSVGWS